MPVFVIDEDVARSTARVLAAQGFVVKDIRDFGLRGASDEAIYRFVLDNRAVLVTADLGFANPLRFPLGYRFGVVILRFPNEVATLEINRQVIEQISKLREEDYISSVIVIEPGRMRMRVT